MFYDLSIFQLIEKINEELPNLENSEETKQIKLHYSNTLLHIKNRMANESQITNGGVNFAGIILD